MQRKQNKKNEVLLCTHGKCERPQTADGEFCKRHYPKSKKLEPLHYGDYGDLEDDDLTTMREELMDYIEKGMTKIFIHKFHELLEVERELTLREGM